MAWMDPSVVILGLELQAHIAVSMGIYVTRERH